ncbi:MAG: 4Fe-4S binding protein [Pseudomonadota bacterium]
MKYWRTPLDRDTIRIETGRVVILKDRCKGCEFCVSYCPRGAIRMSASFNVKGYHFPEAVEGAACVNCHFCESICPDFAIFSVEDNSRP